MITSAITGRDPGAEMQTLARPLAAGFERAALDIVGGADLQLYRNELKRMLAEACARG